MFRCCCRRRPSSPEPEKLENPPITTDETRVNLTERDEKPILDMENTESPDMSLRRRVRRLSELASGLPFVDASVQNTPIPPRRAPYSTKYVVDNNPMSLFSSKMTSSFDDDTARLITANSDKYDALLTQTVRVCTQLQHDLDGYIKTISPK